MKATTLYKYGKKVELAEEMYHQKVALLERQKKILNRLKTTQIIKTGWFQKKRQLELTERLQCKVDRNEIIVKKLLKLKDKYIEDFKYQREACGLIDHTFIDKFYEDKA
ncbi:MAG: hypothetical protein C0603_03780 [Denitrovibrio sp.]|nr:MAG: hypothetical protein C0603_03780 [Denitrovibrio sp.]